jgi:hypothetical protein
MKKVLFLLLLISNIVSAQFKPKIAVDYFIGGFSEKTIIQVVDGSMKHDNSIFIRNGEMRIRTGADYKYKGLTAYFDQHIYMDKSKGIVFQPLSARWFVGLKYKVTKDITFNYEHLCIHPIQTDNNDTRSKIYGGYDMISVSYGY